jgi:hypothetical protein
MTIVVFVVVAVLWGAFGAALVLRRESLGTAGRGFRTASRPVQAVEGVVLLPWVLGLAIWRARRALWLPLVSIARLAWTSLYVFLPGHRR